MLIVPARSAIHSPMAAKASSVGKRIVDAYGESDERTSQIACRRSFTQSPPAPRARSCARLGGTAAALHGLHGGRDRAGRARASPARRRRCAGPRRSRRGSWNRFAGRRTRTPSGSPPAPAARASRATSRPCQPMLDEMPALKRSPGTPPVSHRPPANPAKAPDTTSAVPPTSAGRHAGAPGGARVEPEHPQPEPGRRARQQRRRPRRSSTRAMIARPTRSSCRRS